MRILYISDRQEGGIRQHVQCIRSCLPTDVASYAIGEDEPFAGRSGHDLREWFQIRRVIRDFKPDVVHFHTIPLMMALYVRFVARLPRVVSIHTPSNKKVAFDRHVLNLAVMPCYFLPVSAANWEGFKARYPKAQGEVFFNPVKVEELKGRKVEELKGRKVEELKGRKVEELKGRKVENIDSLTPQTSNSNNLKSQIKQSHPLPSTHNPQPITPIIGMVGRNAAVKDWPSFHAVVDRVRSTLQLFNPSTFQPFNSSTLIVWNLGEREFCPDAKERIAQMDLFVMTSFSEELPTTVLECFQARTPICGFIPRGGMADILELSNGALSEVFIEERSVEKLAEIVLRVLGDAALRQRLVEDGWQILINHFDAEKNCRGQLMEVYGRVEKLKC